MKFKDRTSLFRTVKACRDLCEFLDFKFLIGKQKQIIRGNKYFMASQSPVLHNMFFGEFKKVESLEYEEFSEIAFEAFVDFVHSGEFEIDEEYLLQLLAIADYFQCQDLLKELIVFFEHNVTSLNAIPVYKAAFLKDSPLLIKKCVTIFEKDTRLFLESPQLKRLSADMLINVISRNTFAADREIELFESVSHWIGEVQALNDTTLTEDDKTKILAQVRLGLITPRHLHEIVIPSGLIDDKRLLKVSLRKCDPTLELSDDGMDFIERERPNDSYRSRSSVEFEKEIDRTNYGVSLRTDGSCRLKKLKTGYCPVFGAKPIAFGVHTWRVKVECLRPRDKGWILLGVTPRSEMKHNHGVFNSSVGCVSDGYQYSMHASHTHYSEWIWCNGDVISLTLDFDNGTLTVFDENDSVCKEFQVSTDEPLLPMFDLYEKGNSIVLLRDGGTVNDPADELVSLSQFLATTTRIPRTPLQGNIPDDTTLTPTTPQVITAHHNRAGSAPIRNANPSTNTTNVNTPPTVPARMRTPPLTPHAIAPIPPSRSPIGAGVRRGFTLQPRSAIG
eukprot:TRINITY_DN32472_c0_g1_i1.p1 TRINITY_DN32472_c0_g1~~TRINITY_DN32472_c0_g1_i1.p1  ORF type:complete len:559 (-),score=118.52 TRINITY_DN32472_c0_g1_i1:154-1830(-)